MAAITTDTNLVLPYRKPLDLYPDSLELLGIGATATDLGDAKHKVVAHDLGTLGDGGRPAMLVFLGDAEGGAPPGSAGLVQLSPAEALVAMIPNTFEQTVRDPAHFGAMARLCEETLAVRCERREIWDLVSAIDRTLGWPERG